MAFHPILCSLFTNKNHEEPIGIYYGNEPANANDILRAFEDDTKNLIAHGFTYNDTLFGVRIKIFMCDGPTKTLIKYSIGHTGYFSC